MDRRPRGCWLGAGGTSRTGSRYASSIPPVSPSTVSVVGWYAFAPADVSTVKVMSPARLLEMTNESLMLYKHARTHADVSITIPIPIPIQIIIEFCVISERKTRRNEEMKTRQLPRCCVHNTAHSHSHRRTSTDARMFGDGRRWQEEPEEARA